MARQPGRMARLSMGVTTAYFDQGLAGPYPPVLLLHAWGESRRAFVRLLSFLPGDLRTVAPDLRGHGDADKAFGGYHLPRQADDVVAFLDDVGIPRALIVGASSGGLIAQQVAVTAPDRVAGLVLTGSPRTLYHRTSTFSHEIDGLRDPLDPTWMRVFTHGFVRRGAIPDWFLEILVEDGLRLPARVWQASLDGFTGSEAPTDLGSIHAPTLVVVGGQDAMLGSAEAAALAEAIPGARVVEYPEAGHLVHWEQPERLAQDIAAFAAEIGPGASPGAREAARRDER